MAALRKIHVPPEMLRILAYLVVVIAGAFGFQIVTDTANQADDAADAVAREARISDAEQCVNSWDRVGELRRVIEQSVRAGSTAGAGAVLDVATQLADSLPPDTDQRLEAAVDERVRGVVAEVVAGYPDPSCDLDAARRTLEGEGA
jgi:hypothetical protein